MIIDHGGRQSGKSTRAVEWALQDSVNRVIVTFNYASVKYLQEMARERGGEITALSWTNYTSGGMRGLKDREVYIDELLLCLSQGHEIAGFSL